MSLEILSPIYKTMLWDFKVTTPTTYLDPSNASCFEQGQWWTLDTSNANQIILCDSNDNAIAFPVWSKKGEGSTQALGQLTVVFLGDYIADTDQYYASGSYSIGTLLMVNSSGELTPYDSSAYVHAICVLPPASNSSKLRFRKLSPFYKAS